MHRVTGVIQQYAWGDPTALPAMLGLVGDGRPWAEYWLGTHPGGPATVEDGVPLAAVVGELGYLLKVLAAAEPLSLQTHPSAAQARDGFARESAAGIPIDAPHRLYRDPNPKPEVIAALTPFEALCGFRNVSRTRAVLKSLECRQLGALLAKHTLREVVEGLYRGHYPEAVAETIERCFVSTRTLYDLAPGPDTDLLLSAQSHARLVDGLAAKYPDEPSVVVALLMNHVELGAGEALFLPAGNLHAYINGVGVELMTASDNVLRGGLTVKHVDVDELLRVVDVSILADPVVRPVLTPSGRFDYPLDAPFRLSRYELTGDAVTHRAVGTELLLCTAGSGRPLASGDCVMLAHGEAIALTGEVTVWVAGATNAT
jgi:mannose-6-phosphate isomerase